MSTIKYYDQQLGKWVVTGASEASDILVTDKDMFESKTNVETVLESHERDIKTLKGNVAWLAKYGGGGSGGSGTGGGTNITGSIAVNGYPDNSTILLTSEGITVDVQCSSKKMTFTISANVTIDGKTISIAKGTNTTSLKITQRMFDNAGITRSCALSISAVNGPSLTQFFWNGYLNVASIRLESIPYESTPYENRFNSYASVNYFLGSTGVYGIHVKLNDSDYIEYKPNSQYNSLNGRIDISLEKLESELKLAIPGGSSTLYLKMFNIDNPTLSATTSVVLNLYNDEPIIMCDGLSDDELSPSEITIFDRTITIPVKFKAIFASGAFKFNVSDETTYNAAKDKLDLKWSPSVYNYNTIVEVAALTLYNVERDQEHKIYVSIKDSGTDNITTNIFYVKLVRPSVNLLTQPKSNEQVIDLNAFNASIENQNWKDNSGKWTANINNINGHSDHVNQEHRYLRLQNSSYLNVKEFQFAPGPTTNFSISTCFKVDYHPDDERTVFQWAILRADKYPSSGILLRNHDLYIGNSKVLTLTDGEIINLTITFSQETSNNTGNLFIYIDGVLETVINTSVPICLPSAYNGHDSGNNVVKSPNLYIGASEYNGEIFNYTDMDLYRFTFYRECLSPYEVLVDYLNNLATSHANGTSIDDKYITDGLARNFISVDEQGTYHHNLYTAANNSDYEKNYSNNLEDIGGTYFNVDNFIAPPSDYTPASIRNDVKNYSCPIPIIFIDVSNSSSWTWKNFISPASAGNSLPEVVASFQYYDQKLHNPTSNIMTPISVMVSQQGTSTLADYIKNLNISFEGDEIQDPHIFCPKASWLPEKQYTLKADIVDSSHSLNTSIGKFVNEEFGIDVTGDNFYPFSNTVKTKFQAFKNSDIGKTYFKDVTLKHGVEGFPCFTIMRFADGTVKSLGIYQFILGRQSPRNLGYEIITGVRSKSEYVDLESELSFPICSNNIEISTTNVEGYWFEFNKNDGFTEDIPFQNLTQDLLSSGKTPDGKDLPAIAGAFWQDDKTYYKSVEIKYDNVSVERVNEAYEFPPFKNLINTIQKLPVTFKRQSVRDNGIVRIGASGGSYPGYRYENNKWIPSSPVSMATRGDAIANLFWDNNVQGATNSYLNLDCFTKYFVITNLFGLLDNFQKNMPIKFFKKDDGNWEPMLLGIYDTDSGLGQDNQANQSISTDLWMSTIGNDPGFDFEEQVYCNDGNSVVVATSNKLFLCDHPDTIYQTINGGNQAGSIYTSAWLKMLNWLIDHGKISGIDDLADYYVDEYFLPQTEGCGELLFNLTYISKYINKYDSGSGNKTNQLNKLHGRRKYQVRSWLKRHIKFLNSMFLSLGSAESVPIKDSVAIPNVTINACVGPEIEVTTNNSVLMSYSNQGSGGYVFCKENVPQKVYFGAPSLEISDASKSHVLSNSESIIKLNAFNSDGEDDGHPLYNFGFQGINNGSLPYLTEFNPSVINRSPSNNNKLGAMSSTYMNDYFTRQVSDTKRLSELRVIDFRNTYGVGSNSYILNIEKGFEKLQELYLNDSCITSVTFPEGVSLKEVNIEGSELNTLILDSQNFIETLDLNNCKSLTNISIQNCNNLKTLSFDKTNYSLATVSIINCPQFETFVCKDNQTVKTISIKECNSLKDVIINNCKILESVDVSINNLEYLNLENCNNLKTLNFVDIQSESINSTLRTLNLNQTAVASTKYNGNDRGLLDLSIFDPDVLTTFTIYNNLAVTHIRFTNDWNKPFNLKSSFYGCTNLERVYGHIRLHYCNYSSLTGLFSSCPKFTIHGPIASISENKITGYGNWLPLTWKGEYVLKTEAETNSEYGYSSSIDWDMTDTEEKIYFHTVKMPFDILGKDYSEIAPEDLFQEGDMVTNICMSSEKDCLRQMFMNTSITVFDGYYICNLIGCSKFDHKVSLYEVGYKSASPSIFSWRKNNNPNKNMFWGCSTVDNGTLSFTSEVTYLDSPTIKDGEVVADDGLFSPLIGLETYYNIFTNSNTCFSRYILRRKNGNYKIKSLRGFGNGEIYDVNNSSELNTLRKYSNYKSNNNYKDLSSALKTGVYLDFFKNLPTLSEILYSFCSTTIQYDTLKLGLDVIKIRSSFNTKVGISGKDENDSFLEFHELFDFTQQRYQSVLQVLGGSFNITGSNDFSVYPKMVFTNVSFHKTYVHEFPSLKTFGYDDNGLGGSYDVGSFNGWIKQIGKNGDSTFPYNIFDNLSKLEIMNGLFKNASKSETITADVILPGKLFEKTVMLKNISCMFKNLKFEYTLSSSIEYPNFKNCKELSDVRELFYYENSLDNYSKLHGSIPYKFFYHGETTKSEEKYVSNWSPRTVIEIKQVRKLDSNGNPLYWTDESKTEQTIEITDYPIYEEVEVETTYSDPNSDPFMQHVEEKEESGIVIHKQVVKNCKTPYSKIGRMSKCFYGCLNLEPFTDNLSYDSYGEANPEFIQDLDNYTYVYSGSKWVLIDKSNKLLKYPKLGYWIYNGSDRSEFSETILNNYYFEDEDASLVIDQVYSNDRYGSKLETLNFMCPPDLLRYCKPSCDITGLFEYCGYNFENVGKGGFIPKDEDSNMFGKGIKGRIVPYLLKPVYQIENISNLFKYCRNLSSYTDMLGNVYQIPKDFFKYTPKIVFLSCAFQGLVFPKNVELKVFSNLTSISGLDIRGIFSTCLYGKRDFPISGVFATNKILKCSGAFSSREITPNDSESAIGFVSIAGDFDGNGHQIVVGSNPVTFKNNFTKNNILELTPHYIYNRYGTSQASEDGIDKINNIVDNFTFS